MAFRGMLAAPETLLNYLNRFYVKRLKLRDIEAVVNAAFDAAAA